MSVSDESANGRSRVPYPEPGKPVEPGAVSKVPPAVRDEEAFLDAVVSHVDEDRSDIEKLRDKVSQWYDEVDGVSRRPADDSVS